MVIGRLSHTREILQKTRQDRQDKARQGKARRDRKQDQTSQDWQEPPRQGKNKDKRQGEVAKGEKKRKREKEGKHEFV
jgi:hypothetical protein